MPYVDIITAFFVFFFFLLFTINDLYFPMVFNSRYTDKYFQLFQMCFFSLHIRAQRKLCNASQWLVNVANAKRKTFQTFTIKIYIFTVLSHFDSLWMFLFDFLFRKYAPGFEYHTAFTVGSNTGCNCYLAEHLPIILSISNSKLIYRNKDGNKKSLTLAKWAE